MLTQKLNVLLEIRNAYKSEAKLLSDLAIRSKAYWGYSKEFMEKCRDELSVQPINIESKNFQYFVGEWNNEIVGFYALEQLSKSEFELEALFVEPIHIGTGIGRALINHAKIQAAELGGQILKIQGDPNAEEFYQAAGGVRTGSKESASIGGRYLPKFEISLIGKNIA